jgi:hypothetical protein
MDQKTIDKYIESGLLVPMSEEEKLALSSKIMDSRQQAKSEGQFVENLNIDNANRLDYTITIPNQRVGLDINDLINILIETTPGVDKSKIKL